MSAIAATMAMTATAATAMYVSTEGPAVGGGEGWVGEGDRVGLKVGGGVDVGVTGVAVGETAGATAAAAAKYVPALEGQ